MTIYDIVSKYGKGKGESQMWDSVKYISDFIEPMKNSHKEEYWRFIKGLYASIAGKHYNEEFAEWQVEQMYFEDKKGNIHKAPYWTKDKIKEVFETIKNKIPSTYNCWDFYVTLNMIKSDNYCMLKDWFPNEEELDSKFIDMAINFLNDIDYENNKCKIWSYFNG